MTSSITPSWPKLTGRQEFEFLADLVMSHSTGDHTQLSLRDVHGGTTRFANNQVIQNVNQRRGALSITVAFGRQHGTASTTDFTAGAVRETLKQAECIARVSPEDPEYLPPSGRRPIYRCRPRVPKRAQPDRHGGSTMRVRPSANVRWKI